MPPSFNQEQKERVGFAWVLTRCNPLTPFGRERKQALQPFSVAELPALERELDAVGQLLSHCRKATGHSWTADTCLVLERFKEIRGTIKKLHDPSWTLDEIDLFELKGFAINVLDLRPLLASCPISAISLDLPDLEAVVALLNPDQPLTRSFFLADSYDHELADVRRNKQDLERRLLRQAAGNRTDAPAALCDNDTRPDPDEQRSLQAQRRQLVVRERQLEERVRRTLTDKLRGYTAALATSTAIVGIFDFLLAKALLADALNSVRPVFTPNGAEIILENAVNPMVAAELETRGRAFVPVSIAIAFGANVVTGANMGGKSVALATVSLHAMLATCGFFVPATRLELPPLDAIIHIAGDLQSTQQGLSSFGAEVVEVERMLSAMQQGVCLATIDEFARGTNPEEGEALMRALLTHVAGYTSFCLASTHYGKVVGPNMRHFQVVGLKQANFTKLHSVLDLPQQHSFEQLQEHMDYRLERLEWHSPPPRDALRVAGLLGLNQELLAIAREFLRCSHDH